MTEFCKHEGFFFKISQFICNLYTYIKYNQQIVSCKARAGKVVLCSTTQYTQKMYANYKSNLKMAQ
jgi:hypothetical protein